MLLLSITSKAQTIILKTPDDNLTERHYRKKKYAFEFVKPVRLFSLSLTTLCNNVVTITGPVS